MAPVPEDMRVRLVDPREASRLAGLNWTEILRLGPYQALHVRMVEAYYEGKERYGPERTARSLCRFTFVGVPVGVVDAAEHAAAFLYTVGDAVLQVRYAHIEPLRPASVDPRIFVRLVWVPRTGALAPSIEGLAPDQTEADVLAAWRAARAVARGLGIGGGRPSGTGTFATRDAFLAELAKAARSLRGRRATVRALADRMAIDPATFHRHAALFAVDWRARVGQRSAAPE